MTISLCSTGHFADFHHLRAHGLTRRDIDRALAAGQILRVRRGVYACAHADVSARRAAAAGGMLTCVSVLRSLGVWGGHDHRLHIQVPSTAGHVRPPSLSCVHWGESRLGRESIARVTPQEALRQAMRCLEAEHAIAALESALRKRVISESEARHLSLIAPPRLAWGLRRRISTSGSGNETVVRLRLMRAGYRCEPQGRVPGLGHQDLVVEECVGLEIDSTEFHTDRELKNDSDRDLHSEGLGRHVLRIRPHHIYQQWPRTLAVIDRAVKDGRALRALRQGREFE
jgi:very-short-patch-repair endonuclease